MLNNLNKYFEKCIFVLVLIKCIQLFSMSNKDGKSCMFIPLISFFYCGKKKIYCLHYLKVYCIIQFLIIVYLKMCFSEPSMLLIIYLAYCYQVLHESSWWVPPLPARDIQTASRYSWSQITLQWISLFISLHSPMG